MIEKLKVEDALRYIRISASIGMLISGYFSLDAWINGGEFVLYLPTGFYSFIVFSVVYALTFLAME